MGKLLIQSCSKNKQQKETPTSAINLYDGYFFRIIKKAKREGYFDSDIDILILSAKYGIIEADKKIEYYDQRMTENRAFEIQDQVISDIANKVSKESYETIIINLGKDYRPAIQGLENVVGSSVKYIEGEGNGVKGKKLKELISSKDE